MTGPVIGFTIFSIAVVIVLSVAIVLVFFPTHLPSRRPVPPAEQTTSGQATRPAAEQPEHSVNAATGQPPTSPLAESHAGVPIGKAAGTAASSAQATDPGHRPPCDWFTG